MSDVEHLLRNADEWGAVRATPGALRAALAEAWNDGRDAYADYEDEAVNPYEESK